MLIKKHGKLSLKKNKNKNFFLNDFYNFQGYPFNSNDFVTNGKYIVYKIANISNNLSKQSTTNLNLDFFTLKIGDVVTGMSGSIGTASIITKNNNYILNQRLLCIRSINPLFVQLTIELNKKLLQYNSTGSVQMNITKNDILNLSYDSKFNNENWIMLSNYFVNKLKTIEILKKIINLLIKLLVNV